ncbi:AAA family ATPase [Oleiagrimonas sp. C23AA]|uniref:nucleotide-binding protein n=1 Tax=Oleiagrimonas sp. C23AA TaxID=2719047 RepID=UPI00142254A7|nr:AAA family ATPase [Oleiagrimonas sp. C23AA]NII11174.1 AAA family ATPase [Oleiagrimonas sp. C23AA]
MSIVEKAAEKLKALRPDEQQSPAVIMPEGKVADDSGSTIERLQTRQHVSEPDGEVPVRWHIDQAALRRAGYLPADADGESRLKDQMRRIKRPLLANATKKAAKVPAHSERIVVTSSGEGEGKTFTSVNLALSLAREPDFEVLLVDGDIPRSSLSRALGLADRPGLMDLLTGDAVQSETVIVPTDIDNLSVVPAGKPHPLTAELFGSRRMETVLDALGGHNRRRLVVFDSSPLLATPESQVLASYMGQVVMVVAARRTRTQALDASLQCLNDSQFVGLILNMSQLSASEDHYGSGYGY